MTLNKKSRELNVAIIQKSKCRGNLKSQIAANEANFRLKMYLIEQKSCNSLTQLEKFVNRSGRCKDPLGSLSHCVGKNKRKKSCIS